MLIDVLLISFLAGLGTALGGVIAIYFGKIGCKSLGFGLGFSSGVMVIIAFVSLLYKAIEFSNQNLIPIFTSFLLGTVIMFLLDFFTPHQYFIREKRFESESVLAFIKVGLFVFIGMTLHNFPEGAVVGIGYTLLPAFGLMLALAIAIHNIPEGIAIALPLKAGGIKKSKIFLLTLLSGLTEMLGAIFSFIFLQTIPNIIPISLGFTGGVMIYLVMDEIIPLATKECNPHSISIGLICGMAFALLLELLV
ncbi:MAG: ZIP family metal transporter [Candidatus Nanoarchaeia archaeon]